ncbi:2-acylglycerophosphoethanolamine acyltransferase [Bacillus sp. M6-12]|uniref:AMP-binding protein n=1 Tax=Bacillus sp. M6-12 TaxID=2054166 RepID=UPI000C779A17|nr:AMP-binding protein [Bacillus sp. M6-12]PLS19565.1 2-acylglycerophosphoethanolamine acyltransferase [Bacillus sp. M6-12]
MIPALLPKALYSPKIINKEKLESKEPCIYIANHTSLLDAVLLSIYLPKNAVFVANTEIAVKYAWAMKGKEVIAVDPMNPYSIRGMLKVLKSGKSLVIFPEGRITVTNNLMKMYSGVTYLSLKTGAKLIPIALNGGEKAKKLTYLEGKVPTQWFPEVSLFVGDAFNLPEMEGATMRQKKEMGTHIIYRKLQNLLFESRMPKQVHLAEMFRQRVKEAPDLEIVEEMKVQSKKDDAKQNKKKKKQGKEVFTKLTLKDLWRKILGLSIAIDNQILQDRVGVLLPTSIANMTTIYALFHSGKTPALLNFSMDVSTLTSCLETGSINVIITSRSFVEKGKLQPLIDGCSKKAEIVYLEDIVSNINAFTKSQVLLQENKKVTSKAGDLILFTSGSEGTPKGVVLSHENIYANVQQARLMIDLTKEEKILNALPMFHSLGLILVFLSTLCHVPTVLVPSPLMYKAIPELAYDLKATILVGTSTFLSAYGRYANPYDFFKLRLAICGGEKLQEHVYQNWVDKFGIRICEGYGLTETAPLLSLQTPMLYKKGSVGCLVPGVKHQLEKVEGIEEGGKLKVQAPNLMKGYLLHETGFVEAPEWFDTGDVVTVDDWGFVTIQGRAKQFVKIGGEMVSLAVVEEYAKSALGVDDVVAVGLSDKRKGEKIELVTTSSDVTIQMVRDYWREKGINPLSLPAKIHTFKTIPILGSGKVNKVEIKKQLEKINE